VSYDVLVLPRVAKQLDELPPEELQRVADAIESLATDPRLPGCKKLTGREGWRIRVGRCRVIYEIVEAARTITVLDAGHRRDIYR
jgi:mRNA interferase RelE/StbE